MAKVLIIDDDENVASLLFAQLSDEGHNVTIARDGQEGMAQACKVQPDLIMLDVFLPDSTGFQMCGQLRKLEITKTVPIIMMTGAARFSSQQLFGFQRGANEYIFKPFNVNEVDELVHKYIGRKSSPQAVKKTQKSDPMTFIDPKEEIEALLIGETSSRPGPQKREDDRMGLSDFINQALTPDKGLPLEVDISRFNGHGKMAEPAARQVPSPAPHIPSPAPKDEPSVAGGFIPSILASKERFIEFSLEIFSLATRLCSTHAEKFISEQLLRTSTAVGQKITESRNAESQGEYMALLTGALKDIRETSYWLMLIRKAGLLDSLKKQELEKTCQSLTTLLHDFVTSEKKRLHY